MVKKTAAAPVEAKEAAAQPAEIVVPEPAPAADEVITVITPSAPFTPFTAADVIAEAYENGEEKVMCTLTVSRDGLVMHVESLAPRTDDLAADQALAKAQAIDALRG